MKELPIFDKEWLLPRVQTKYEFSSILTYYPKTGYYADMESYSNCNVILKLNTKHLRYFSAFSLDPASTIKGLSDRYLFFVDEIDDCFYYLDLKSKDLQDKVRKYTSNWYTLTDKKSAYEAIALSIINVLDIPNTLPNLEINKNIVQPQFNGYAFTIDYEDDRNLAAISLNDMDYAIQKFKHDNKKELQSAEFSKQVWSIIRNKFNNVLPFDKYAEKVIKGKFESDYALLFYNRYRKECMEEILAKNRSEIIIKQLLTSRCNRFSGQYRVVLYTAQGTKNRSYIDSVDVEIGMMALKDDNIKFIESNKKEVLNIIRKILEYDEKSSPYANYLQMTSMKLTRDQTILVQLKFKDGFKEIFKEMEEEDEGI